MKFGGCVDPAQGCEEAVIRGTVKHATSQQDQPEREDIAILLHERQNGDLALYNILAQHRVAHPDALQIKVDGTRVLVDEVRDVRHVHACITFARNPELLAFELREDSQELVQEANKLLRDVLLVLRCRCALGETGANGLLDVEDAAKVRPGPFVLGGLRLTEVPVRIRYQYRALWLEVLRVCTM